MKFEEFIQLLRTYCFGIAAMNEYKENDEWKIYIVVTSTCSEVAYKSEGSKYEEVFEELGIQLCEGRTPLKIGTRE